MGNLERELNKYRYIILDFDGTIVDLHVNWQELKIELSQTFGLNFNVLNEGLRRLSEDERKIAFKIIEKYENEASWEVNARLLDYIRRNDKNYAIFSDNMTSTIRRILSALSIIDKFDIIIGKDSVKKFKPDEEGLIRIINYFGVRNLGEVIYVGDNEKDKIVAKKMNIKFLDIRNYKGASRGGKRNKQRDFCVSNL